MEEETSYTRKIYEQVEQYAKTSLELYKLKAIQNFAGVFAAISTGLIIWMLFTLFLFFASLGAAFYLGDRLGKWHYGFFIVAGFYVLVAAIVYALRKKYVKERINSFIIHEIFKD